MDLLTLMLLLVLFLLVESSLYRYFGLKRVEYRRAFGQHNAVEGDQVQMVEVIRNRKLLPLPWLRVESRMAPQLVFGKRSDMEVSGLRYHRSVFFLSPFQQITRRHRVTVTKRGVYHLDSVTLTAGDLFGAGDRTITIAVSDELVVYPREISWRQALPMLGTQGDAIVRRFILPDPFLYRGVRPFREGDSMRDVHWRATAKKAELYVREMETTRNSNLIIILNTQMFDEQWDNLSDEQREQMELGVRLALTLSNRALEEGCRVGFLCNGTLLGLGETVSLPPAGGRGQSARLRDMLARLQLVRHTSFPLFLRQQTQLRGQDLLVLSWYGSESIQRELTALEKRGNQTALVLFGGGKAYEANAAQAVSNN